MIRKATPKDARGIHDAHMHSIQTLCAKEHTHDEILAWGHRPFNEGQRLAAIQNQYVWVVEIENNIEGYGQLKVYEKDGHLFAHVMGLYLTPKAVGKKFGQTIFKYMYEEAKLRNVEKINLESTLTSHGFYQKLGFKNSGPLASIEISGTPTRCIPMSLKII